MERPERCACRCHDTTLADAREAKHHGSSVAAYSLYVKHQKDGYEAVERADELAAFFACIRCLPLHCVALNRRSHTRRPPPPPWTPDDEPDGN